MSKSTYSHLWSMRLPETVRQEAMMGAIGLPLITAFSIWKGDDLWWQIGIPLFSVLFWGIRIAMIRSRNRRVGE